MASVITYAMVAKGIAVPPKPAVMKKTIRKPIAVAVPRLEDIERMRQFARAALEVKKTSELPSSESNATALSKTIITVDDVSPTGELLNSNKTSGGIVNHTETKRVDVSTEPSVANTSLDSKSDHDSSQTTTSDENGAAYSWTERANETFVDTIEKLHVFLPNLVGLKKNTAQLFCDLEGDNLGKPPGTISLLQMTIGHHTWIFDVTVLKNKVFNTMGARGQSIRQVLESKDILKVWWDARNDANALFFHYQVRLAGIEDLQLMELATRSSRSRKYRAGLGDCVGLEGVACGKMTTEKADAWTSVKRAGKRYFKANPLGYGVFDVRPLPSLAIMYAGQDTCHMPMLYAVYMGKMRYAEFGMSFVRKESSIAVEDGCKEEWNPQGDHRGQHALAPPSFAGDVRVEKVNYIKI